jgi:hypothetical protein
MKKDPTKKTKKINELLAEFVEMHSPKPQPEEERKMTYEQAMEILKKIEKNKSAPTGKAFVEAAIRYARFRVDHYLAGADAQQLIGSQRSAAHNALIAACDDLAKQMAADGEDTSWRTDLTQDRKTIGDFACYLHCILGIRAR